MSDDNSAAALLGTALQGVGAAGLAGIGSYRLLGDLDSVPAALVVVGVLASLLALGGVRLQYGTLTGRRSVASLPCVALGTAALLLGSSLLVGFARVDGLVSLALTGGGIFVLGGGLGLVGVGARTERRTRFGGY